MEPTDERAKVSLRPSLVSIFGAGSLREARATAEVENYMAGIPLREGIDEILKPSTREVVPDTSDEERTPQAPQRRRLVGDWTPGGDFEKGLEPPLR